MRGSADGTVSEAVAPLDRDLKGSGQFPTRGTAHDSVVPTCLIACGLIKTLSPRTVGVWHQLQGPVVRLTLLSLRTVRPLPDPWSWLTSWNPEAPA